MLLFTFLLYNPGQGAPSHKAPDSATQFLPVKSKEQNCDPASHSLSGALITLPRINSIRNLRVGALEKG